MKHSKTKKISKTAKRRLVILVPVTIVVVAYFVISCSYYVYKIYSLKSQEVELKTELNNLHSNESELKTNIEKLQNPEYLARYARENYQYSKDGELVIQKKDKNKTTEENKTTTEKNDNKIFASCILILLLVLIYIIRKSRKNKKKKR